MVNVKQPDFQILHSSINLSLPLDPKLWSNQSVDDLFKSGALRSFTEGKVVAMGSDGFLKIAESMADKPIGMLTRSVVDSVYNNAGALSTGLVSVAVFSHLEAITPEVDLTSVIKVNTSLSVKDGLVCAAKSGEASIGIALADMTPNFPFVHGLFFHNLYK